MPGKVLAQVTETDTILDVIYHRLDCLKIPIIFAIPDSLDNDQLSEYLQKRGYATYRGSEENVLKRMEEAGQQYQLDYIVRVCSDNLFIQAPLIANMIDATRTEPVDYTSYYLDNDTPTILTHFGFFAEIVKRTALQKVLRNTDEKVYLEHVTNYIYQNPHLFHIKKLSLPPYVNQWDQKIRLTIDTPEDFAIAKAIYPVVEAYDMVAIIHYLASHEMYGASMVQRINQYKK